MKRICFEITQEGWVHPRAEMPATFTWTSKDDFREEVTPHEVASLDQAVRAVVVNALALLFISAGEPSESALRLADQAARTQFKAVDRLAEINAERRDRDHE